MSANNQQLPPAKEKQYESLVNCYEEKEYKKGIKVANTILKEYPKNGKTLCMKALCNYLITKDKETAEKEIKSALLLDPKSDMCWQTLGLFYRHCKNYAEARKAFSMASMRNPSNLQVTIDLATLHMQNRDIPGYRKCYQKLINQLSNRGNFWLGLMVGYCLEGNYSKCLEAISVFRETLSATPSYERQELVNLEVRCYEGMNDYPKAIAALQTGMKDILNEDAGNEHLAILLGKNNQLKESQQVWERLLKRNNENYRYYRGVECCLLNRFDMFEKMDKMELLSTSGECSDVEKTTLLSFYEPLLAEARPSHAVQTICLYLFENEAFETLVRKLIKRAIRKGIPSFFRSIRPLLTLQKEKFAVVQSIAESYLQSLQQTGSLEEGEEEDPFVFLWLVLLLAQIEDAQHHTSKALEYTDMAYAHTPTCYDYYIIRARILKHAGLLKESADILAKGYELDLADRFTNTKLTKYYLKSGNIAAADKTVSYWTKKKIPNRIDLNNLQGNWFEVLCGKRYLDKNDVVHANKLFTNVINHFDTYIENQFDFHPYVLRKSALSVYFKFLEYTNRMYDHKYYRAAACGALRCAVELAKNPITDPEAYLKQFGSIPDTTAKREDEDDKDNDLDGMKLAQEEKPLERMEGVAKRLLEIGGKDLDCMESVLMWAIAAKKSDMIGKVLENVKEVLEIAWLAMKKRVEEGALLSEAMKGGMSDESILDSSNYALIDSIRYLAEVRGVEQALEKIGGVERFSLEQWKKCYNTFKKLRASSEQLAQLEKKAEEFYCGIKEYQTCCAVC